MSFSTRQRLSDDSGRLSTICTRSPVLNSFFSSCALYFVRLFRYLPYLASETRRSTITTRVLFILSLVTTPIRRRLWILWAGTLGLLFLGLLLLGRALGLRFLCVLLGGGRLALGRRRRR